MGGINHQPCSKYLRNSTHVSRSLSLARAAFESANVALEDIILAELAGADAVSIDTVVSWLNASSARLADAQTHMLSLKTQMDMEKYVDLPPYRSLDLQSLGRAMADEGLLEVGAWKDIVKFGHGRGFYGVLDEFLTVIDRVQALTFALAEKTLALRIKVNERLVEETLETNAPESIKREFALLYTEWNFLSSRFLASSLLSTEVWYKFNGYGSLLSQDLASVRVA